jgi:hypothetical protein
MSAKAPPLLVGATVVEARDWTEEEAREEEEEERAREG